MQRVNTPEILDSVQCPSQEVEASLRDLSRINRWFGGVATTRALIWRVATATGQKHFSLLEVAAGFGEVPKIAARQLARKRIAVEVTLLDRARSHLLPGNRSVVADALALPFPDCAFDLVSCNLFAHHLGLEELTRFAREALRVSRRAVLINDLIRHPLHLALVYAGFPAYAEPCVAGRWRGFGAPGLRAGGDARGDCIGLSEWFVARNSPTLSFPDGCHPLEDGGIRG